MKLEPRREEPHAPSESSTSALRKRRQSTIGKSEVNCKYCVGYQIVCEWRVEFDSLYTNTLYMWIIQ